MPLDQIHEEKGSQGSGLTAGVGRSVIISESRRSLHSIPRDSVGTCLPAFTPCYRLNSFRVVPLRALDKNSLGACVSVLKGIVMGEVMGRQDQEVR